MAREIVKEREYIPDETDRTVVRETDEQSVATVASKVVYTVFSIIVTLLLLRFILALLGANRANDIVHAIYTLTQPLVSPFANFFNNASDVTTVAGSRFELETLVAIVFYVLIGWIIARLIAVFDARETV